MIDRQAPQAAVTRSQVEPFGALSCCIGRSYIALLEIIGRKLDVGVLREAARGSQ